MKLLSQHLILCWVQFLQNEGDSYNSNDNVVSSLLNSLLEPGKKEFNMATNRSANAFEGAQS